MRDQFEKEEERKEFERKIKDRNKKLKKLHVNNKTTVGFKLDTPLGINYEDKIMNQMQMINDSCVIYCQGPTVIIKDLVAHQYMILQKENRLRFVTALTANIKKQGKIFVGIGESTFEDEKVACVTLISVQKNKWRTLSSHLKGLVKKVIVIPEQKWCIALIQCKQTSNFFIFWWNYKLDLLLTHLQISYPVHTMLINPQKPSKLYLLGSNYLRQFELVQKKILKESAQALVSQKFEKEYKFLDIIQLKDNYTQVVLLEGQKILIIQNELVKLVNLSINNVNISKLNCEEEISNDELSNLNTIEFMLDKILSGQQNETQQSTNDDENNQKISSSVQFLSLCATRKGFIVGGTQGIVSFFEIDDSFKASATIVLQVMYNHNANSQVQMISSSSNDSLVSLISYHKSYSFTILNTYHIDSDVSPVSSFFPIGFHQKKILQLTSNVSKSIFASCSEDNTIKVYSLQDNNHQEIKGIISKKLIDDPLSISMHPSGQFIAASFFAKFIIFGILKDSLKQILEIQLSQAEIIKYSNGGHFMIVNERHNIHVFNTFNYQKLYSLAGHKFPVKAIKLSEDDLSLVSVDSQGYVFYWDLMIESNEQTKTTIKQHEYHNPKITSIDFDSYYCQSQQSDLFVCSTFDHTFSIYKNRLQDLVVQFPVSDCFITNLMILRKLGLILMGTNKGSIRASLWPMNDQTLEQKIVNIQNKQVMFVQPEFIEISAHNSAITCLEITHDLKYIISGAEDGSIYIVKLNLLESQLQEVTNISSKDKEKIYQKLDECFLETNEKLDDEAENLKRQFFEVTKAEQTVIIETQKLESLFREQIDQLSLDYQQKIEIINQNINNFKAQSQVEKDQLDLQLKIQEDELAQKLVNQNQSNKEKIQFQHTLKEEKQSEIQNMRANHKNKMLEILERHQEDQQKLNTNFKKRSNQIHNQFLSVSNNAHQFGKKFIETLSKKEQEDDNEIEDSIKELKMEIQKIKNQNQDLSKLNTKLLQENGHLKKKDQELQIHINDLVNEHSTIRYQNLKNDEDIIKMQHQLLERLQVIENKEDTCKNNKDEQINLENFRFILDQKIKMLYNEKNQINEKIKEKEANLKQMFDELIKESSFNDKKQQELNFKKREQQIYIKNLKSADEGLSINKNVFQMLQNQMLQCMKSEVNFKSTSLKIQSMVEKAREIKSMQKCQTNEVGSFQEMVKRAGEKKNELNDEILKQAQQLNKKLFLIDENGQHLKEIREENVELILGHNTQLIEECNFLRSENERYRKLNKNNQREIEVNEQKIDKLKKKLKNDLAKGQGNIQILLKKNNKNQKSLNTQSSEINDLKSSMQEILYNTSDDDTQGHNSTKLPKINQGISQTQSLSDFSLDQQIVHKKKYSRNELLKNKDDMIIEDHKDRLGSR